MSGRLHLDKRAADLAEQISQQGSPDDLLDTKAIARWLGVSTQFLEIARCKSGGRDGPAFIRLSSRRVRYRRSDVIAWLKERTYRRTGELVGM